MQNALPNNEHAEMVAKCLMRCSMTVAECERRQTDNMRYYAKSLRSDKPQVRSMFITCAKGNDGEPCRYYLPDLEYCRRLGEPAERTYKKFLGVRGDVKEAIQKLLQGGGNA